MSTEADIQDDLYELPDAPAEELEILRTLNMTEAKVMAIAVDYLTDFSYVKTARRLGLPFATVWRIVNMGIFDLCIRAAVDTCPNIKEIITLNRIAFRLWELANDEIESRPADRKAALESLTKLLDYDPSKKVDVTHQVDPSIKLSLTSGEIPLDIEIEEDGDE